MIQGLVSARILWKLQLFCLEIHLDAAQCGKCDLTGHSRKEENSLCLHFFWLCKCCADLSSLLVAALFCAWCGKARRQWLILLNHFTGDMTLRLVTHRHFSCDWISWRRLYFNMFNRGVFQPNWKVVNDTEEDHTLSIIFLYKDWGSLASGFWPQSWNLTTGQHFIFKPSLYFYP